MKIDIKNKKRENVTEMIIDTCDYKTIKGFPLYFNKGKGYVTTVFNGKTMGIHRLIVGDKKGLVVDHTDRNKLNNRRGNLRYATVSQNGMNRNNTKGYCFNKQVKKWQAYIKLNKTLIFLGTYKKEDDARKARKKAELYYFGEFSPI